MQSLDQQHHRQYPRRVRAFGWLTSAIIGALLWAVSSPVQAQERKKITLDDPLVVEGTVQKPEAFFILTRSPINRIIKDMQKRENLKKKIVEELKNQPFENPR